MMGFDREQALLDEIMLAMERQEIKAYYQPQYDAITGRIVSAEALARWCKADGSIVMPGGFVPMLESSGDIISMDWYILGEVCSFLKDCIVKGLPTVPIAVNFSRLHILYDEGFVEKICDVVDSYDVAHKLIEIEITESALVDKPENIYDLIKNIRDKGFKVAIDDFGSGLSSLSFVKDICVDVLKIDKSLLSKNCEDEKERIVLESIFGFANRLKLITVAEGVETREQLGFLRTCGCKKIQGFLYSKAVPEDSFRKMCEEDSTNTYTEDILITQSPASATQLLLDAIFIRYPLVIFSNLTRNSFYMMAYENFSSTSCPSTGNYEELIAHGATTMHPDDREAFANTFDIANQLKVYASGEKSISIVTRQMCNDGIYRRVETVNYFVRNPASADVLVITLCHNL